MLHALRHTVSLALTVCFFFCCITLVTNFLIGVQSRVSEEIAALKAQCTAGILAQLSKNLTFLFVAETDTASTDDLLAPTTLSKMVYSDFFTQITLKHHIIYENWPVSKFCTPGKLTLLELRRLHHVLMNGAPLFRHVPLAEWEGLDLDAFQMRYDSISPTAAQPLVTSATVSTVNAASPSANNTTGPSTCDATGPSADDAPTNDTSTTSGGSTATAPALPQPSHPPPGPGGDMFTLDGGMVVRPRQRRRQWDAGLTKEQKAEVLALREAEKANKTGRSSQSGGNTPQE